MGVPTVLLGLIGYALFSRRGPLGPLDLLYTPGAIILCELLLALPMIVALAHSAAAAVDPLARETALTLGGGRWRALTVVASEARSGVAAAVLAAFGRVATELGIALMVGGNLKGQTRTLTTAIALETSRGDFARAVALGTILLALAGLAAAGSLVCERRGEG
jgi:tungstate transport system permease protein